jgi:ATP-dependent RNA helicase DDX5/DBP2
LDDQQLKRINWQLEQLAPLRKNFYKPAASVLARSRTEIADFHHKHEITVRGMESPETIFEFNEVGFPSYVTTELARQGFKQPTVIQSQSWPIAMSGRDMVGIAQTGSGKFDRYCEIQ